MNGSTALSFTIQGAQGDVYFTRVDSIPEGYTPREPEGKTGHVVAHSESGHNHVVDASDVIRFEGSDPGIAYLRLVSDSADVVHQRGFDTHGTVSLLGGPGAVWQVTRQREYDPAGERRAAD